VEWPTVNFLDKFLCVSCQSKGACFSNEFKSDLFVVLTNFSPYRTYLNGAWLRATSRKVAGCVPYVLTGLSQPLTGMTTRATSWEVKAASA